MPREIIQPSSLLDPRPRYAQVSRNGNQVYLAGQLALDVNGNLVGKGDIETQTRKVFENLKRCLDAVGASFDNVVKINVYLTSITDQLGAVSKVRQEHFKTEAVPSTTVEVSALAHPDCLLEIEAIALMD
jgi:reactive intermediate/imine deaminase